MDVTCEKCQTEYEFDDALVSEVGTSVRCTQCGHRFKVRRAAGGGAPEVWIVRTVDGQALEFRVLRELKNAIASGKISRDDVLSRGSGRPRRLASIAELEPFFSAQPRASLTTAPGLGALESPRPRKQTPSGLGPGPEGLTTEGSVAIPLPKDPSLNRAPPPAPPPPAPAAAGHGFDEDERTEVQKRRATKELRGLGQDSGPASFEPPTIPDPPLSGEAPPTALGVQPPAPIPPAPDSITKTMSYGTPRSREPRARDAGPRSAASPADVKPASLERHEAPPPVSEPEPVTGKRPVPFELEATVPRSGTPPPAKAEPAVESGPRRESSPEPRSGPSSSRAAMPPPAVDPPIATPTPPPDYASAEPPRVEPRAPKRAPEVREHDGRASVLTPTPPDARYSLSGEEGEIVPSGLRASTALSRRSSGSMRLIVGLVLGGAVAFGAVVVWQKYVSTDGQTADTTTDPRVVELLEAGEKALRDGDLEGANERFVKASGIDEKHPGVAKSLARLAVVRADLAWLELRILPSDDRAREKVRDRLIASVDRAQKAVTLASSLAKDDPDVASLSVDARRIAGDVAGARKLASAIPASGASDSQLVLGALDMADRNLPAKSPGWADVLDRLAKAADEEGALGRARALLIYAAALAGDMPRAHAELDRLSKLARAHPLESDLRRFLERVDKGESPTLAIDDLPTIPSSPASGGPSDSLLKVAQDALAKGNYVKAEELYRDIVSREQNNAEALFGLAQASLGQGKGVPAKAFLERAVAANPGHAPAVMALAGVKWDAGERAEAAQLYKKALDLGISGKAADLARSRSQPAVGSGAATPPTAPPTGDPTSTVETPPPEDTTPSGPSDVPPDL